MRQPAGWLSNRKRPKMLNYRLPRHVPLLLVLLVLLSACGHDSPLFVPPAHQPAIPPLPTQARQTESPEFSANAQIAIERWLQLLTEPSSLASPVKPATKR